MKCLADIQCNSQFTILALQFLRSAFKSLFIILFEVMLTGRLTMDYDVMNKDSPDRLVDSFHSDCARVETLAMESLREQPMPILSTLRTLSKGDCAQLLQHYSVNQHTNVEQAMMLSLLTDYVTCAYRGPDWFFTFHRKTDRYGARSLFVSLNSSWYSLFCCCTPQDLTEDQLAGALSSLTRSVSRLLDVSHRLTFKGALEAGQARLRLFKQQNLPQGQETSASSHTPISALKENASKENWAGLCNVEVKSGNQEQIVQPTLVTVKTSLSPLPHRKKKTKKYTCDITKYIVKPSEPSCVVCSKRRVWAGEATKRKSHDMDKVVSSLPLASGFSPSTKENKAQEALVPMSPNSVKVGEKACPDCPLQAATLCNILTTEESPLKNKPSFADKNRPVMANGRVNAFALMMKHSSESKNFSNKGKYCFQT
ncbi:unnamed protein product [Timema podura]|uniref:Uncharacterized protein n=1 Tax=Timema podura TaxID=61482 RepID=A0ABN7NJB6_TIMPD|nr:unnamed protein product [Timema podura]